MTLQGIYERIKLLKRALLERSPRADYALPIDMNCDENAKATMAFVRPYTMTTVERLYGLIQAVRYLEQSAIEGAFVECGVWRGGSSMAMALTLKQIGNLAREFYLYDTFEGMTPPSENDVDNSGVLGKDLLEPKKIENDPSSVWCYSSIDDVKGNIGKTNYPFDKWHLVKGDVEKTLPEKAPRKIALLRLDTDWYESTKHELECLFPLLSPGGILIIDDYGHWKGARKAVDEYFEKNNISILLNRLDYTGRIAIKI